METSELLKVMFEAPEDEAPDANIDAADATPDEAPPAAEEPIDDSPPDMGGDDTGGDEDAPPDMADEDFGDDTGDEGFSSEDDQQTDMKLDDKVSAVLNLNLYQRFLTLITDISSKLSSLKMNADILYVISDKTPETIKSFKLLDENIRLYLTNSFTNERYENNLLFFNKCLNLYKLLNDKFNDNISKGIKSIA